MDKKLERLQIVCVVGILALTIMSVVMGFRGQAIAGASALAGLLIWELRGE